LTPKRLSSRSFHTSGSKLGSWREKIEKLEGEIRYYNNLVSLSTLNITLIERDIRTAAMLSETEQVNMGVEATDVETARSAAIKAIEEAKGRIVESDLKKLEAGQYAAKVVSGIPKSEAERLMMTSGEGDFARGLAARYVSGYICPKDKEMRGEGATHAWVEAYIPNYGWLGLDPTNNCLVNDRHVRLAVGRNFLDCTPVKGTYKGSGEHTLEVSVEIKNGDAKKSSQKQGPPKFSYEAKNPGEPINSYRYYLEVQQKQQQQQQQQ